MRIQSQRTLLRLATATAVVCTAAVIFLPAAVSAFPMAPSPAAVTVPHPDTVISSISVR